jgi:bifunctional non-homologous end joining protein LigD
MVIAGYTRGHGRRQGGLGALVLGVRRGTDLVWAGNCGTGFGERERRRLEDLLRPLERPTPPFAAAPRMPRVRRDDVTWVEPELVCEVEFSEWTHDGRLRAPSYQGLRDDKPAEEVRREMPVELELGEGRRRLQLKNLDKVFWPDEGITKGDLVDYYRQIAPTLVPHLAGRPFTMKRFPDGIAGQSFFQKDAPKHMPEWIRTAAFPATSRDGRRVRTINYPLVDDELALLWMAGMGCIDMNAWYSRVDKADRPDFVLFDLDPSEGASFADCVRVAHLVHEALGALGLEALVKTSGSKGIHVIAPIVRRHTYAETRAFAEGVAGALERLHPGLVTTEWSKAKRRGILIDANQNGQGRTIASVYSVRPRPGAPVSTPLRWDELTEDIDPRDFTMAVVLDRVSRHGDLMEPALHAKQGLGKALRALA